MTTSAQSAESTFAGFERTCARYPDRTALIYLGQHTSYRRLQHLSNCFAASLRDLGIAKGDRVLLYLPNCPQWVVAFLAIQKLGAVIVPVAPIYTSHELEYLLEDSGAKTIVCMDTNFGYVRDVMAAVGLQHVIVTNLVEMLPLWKRALGVALDRVPRGKVARRSNVYWFRQLLRHAPLERAAEIDALADLSYLLYTGGTTGFPKGVPGNHAGMSSFIHDFNVEVAGPMLREDGDVYIAINPLFHIMALGLFLALSLNNGMTTVLMPVPQVDAVLESIQRYRVRWMLGVPSLYRMILDNDRLDRYALNSLACCFCGGDVLPEEIYNRWLKHVGIPIHQVYGSTEVGHVSYSRLDRPPRPGTIGLPLSSRQCLVVDPATLEPVAPGKGGELLVTSPWTVKEYWRKPEETAATFVRMGEDVYCRMGDTVRCDAEGELSYVERSADIIKHKGFRVAASEVEAVLQDHPTVVAACVVGVPDYKVGERIKAIVVLKEDARGVGGPQLIHWCRERLADYKVPAYIEFRDMLPKSKVGKLLRREIRDEERRRTAPASGTTIS